MLNLNNLERHCRRRGWRHFRTVKAFENNTTTTVWTDEQIMNVGIYNVYGCVGCYYQGGVFREFSLSNYYGRKLTRSWLLHFSDTSDTRGRGYYAVSADQQQGPLPVWLTPFDRRGPTAFPPHEAEPPSSRPRRGENRKRVMIPAANGRTAIILLLSMMTANYPNRDPVAAFVLVPPETRTVFFFFFCQ